MYDECKTHKLKIEELESQLQETRISANDSEKKLMHEVDQVRSAACYLCLHL